MRTLAFLAVLYCVPWSPCYAEDFRWGRWEPVPWVPEQAAAMFVYPPSIVTQTKPISIPVPISRPAPTYGDPPKRK